MKKKKKNLLAVTVERSQVTDKWLVVLYLFSNRRVISPHFKRSDAVAASKIVEQVFGEYTPEQLLRPQIWSQCLQELHYEDDDEPLGVLFRNADGKLVENHSSPVLIHARATFDRLGLLSNAVKQRY